MTVDDDDDDENDGDGYNDVADMDEDIEKTG